MPRAEPALFAQAIAPQATDEAYVEGEIGLRVEGAETLALEGNQLRLITAVGEFALPLLQADGITGGVPTITDDQVASPFATAFLDLQPAVAAQSSPSLTSDSSDLVYSTFLGGCGNDYGYGSIAVDPSGSGAVYVTGYTSSINIPVTAGAFTYQGGSSDAFVAKLSADGSVLEYFTYLGGSSYEESNGLAVDTQGAAYVSGYTTSSDFPLRDAIQMTNPGGGAFVTKLGVHGNTLVYSTFLGGSGSDIGNGIAVDASGSAYVSGTTNSSDFPTTPGARQTTYGGGTCRRLFSFPCFDIFVAKLNVAGNGLVYSTYVGGAGNDGQFVSTSVVVDSSGAAYIAGFTSPNTAGVNDFPTTDGAWDRTPNGGADVFVAKLNASGSDLAYSTYLGGVGRDEAYDLAVDASGAAYVTGFTFPSGFPTTPGAFQTAAGFSDAFVAKLNPVGSALAYSTYLAAADGKDTQGFGIAVNVKGEAYVSGQTVSTLFPTTPEAFQTTFGGNNTFYYDAFITKFSADGTRLLYSTYLGATGDDWSHDITVDASGAAYVTGQAGGPDFPISPGAFQTIFGGRRDVFITKLALGGGVEPAPTAREPVIFLPGTMGSQLVVDPTANGGQGIDVSIDNGHGGTWTNDNKHYAAGEVVWANITRMGNENSLIDIDDDYFDALKFDQLGNPLLSEIEAGNVITRAVGSADFGVFQVPIDKDVYDSLINYLTQTAGYVENQDLFLFGYDWRQDLNGHVPYLDATIREALRIANGGETNEALWTVTQVNLITHSMGGSVAQAYVSDPTRASRVHRLIALAPAFLGSPKLLKGALFGDDLDFCQTKLGITHCILQEAEVKDLVHNMPGPFEFTPSRGYWDFYDGGDNRWPVLFNEARDVNGNGRTDGSLDYTQTMDTLFNHLGLNPNMRAFAEAFHAPLDGAWAPGIPIPEINIITAPGSCTVGQFRPFSAGTRFGPRPAWMLNYVNGDNTVPLFSSTLFNPDNSAIDNRGGARVYYFRAEDSGGNFVPTAHSNITAQRLVWALIGNILAGESSPVPPTVAGEGGFTTDPTAIPKCAGTVINVESPVELHVFDAAGNHTGPETVGDASPHTIIEEGIPHSAYDDLEGDKFIYLPASGTYTVKVRATEAGTFNLRIRTYADDQVARTIVFLDAPLTSTTTGELTYDTSASEPPMLRLDHDGDGVFDETLTPTSVLGAAESQDSLPPVIAIQSPADGSTVAGKTMFGWTVTDDLSGVLSETAEIDSGALATQPAVNGSAVFLPPGSHTLTVIAADRLGNVTEKVSTFTVVGPCNLLDLTALLDDLQANGLIAQRGVYESLRQKLVDAQKELDKGKRDKAAEKVWDFVEQLDKEAGKGRVNAVGAALLQDGAFCILGTLGKDETSLREIESLRDLVATDYQQGLITSVSLRDKLDEQLSKAQEKLVDEGAKKAADELTKFIADVTKERGKKINTAVADELLARAQRIVARLNVAGDDDD